MSSSTRAHSQAREMMYCHECQDEWYRDEHGIICPACQSEFTEVIETNNDPRDHHIPYERDSEEDDPDISIPYEHDDSAYHRARQGDAYWHSQQSNSGEGSTVHFHSTGPGQYRLHATVQRTVSPGAFGQMAFGGRSDHSNTTTAGPIGSVFSSFLGTMLQTAQAQSQAQSQSHREQTQTQSGRGEGLFSGPNSEPQRRTFTYSSGARLHPPDATHPQARVEPTDDLNNVLTGLFAAFGQPVHVDPHRDPAHQNQGPPDMFSLMNMMLASRNGQLGDAVYSQEALDRVISQLMEQTATSNAPGPAAQADVDSLPRREVTKEMLGSEGRAECSICMDEVDVGEQVTMLPCKHWFHHPCIAAWLAEHDTCPHCRQGISNHNDHSSHQPHSSPSSASQTTANMPGAFASSGRGSPQDPQYHANSNAQSGSGGGITDRIRRGLFGPQG